MSSDNFSSGQYRSRYSAEESSDLAFECDQRHLRCMGRKRHAMQFVLFVTFVFVAGVFTRIYLFFSGIRGGRPTVGESIVSVTRNETLLWGLWKKMSSLGTDGGPRAELDSYGFFADIPDEQWQEMKKETKTMIDLQDGIGSRTSYLLSESGANINSNVWWSDNWKTNFHCKNKVKVGGHWLCDPTRLIAMADEAFTPKRRGKEKKNKECLLYISGGMAMGFSQQFLDFSAERMLELHRGEGIGDRSLAPCEVHVFSPNGQGTLAGERDGLFVHHWGFRPSNKESMGLATDNESSKIAFKTLKETIDELDHGSRPISVLALDCESCEWDIYRDILGLDEPIQQVILQMHGTPYMANELFLAMQEAGYVVFNREPEPSGKGEVYDYSWLKLSPSFFNWKLKR